MLHHFVVVFTDQECMAPSFDDAWAYIFGVNLMVYIDGPYTVEFSCIFP
jgi:hypothetical protein